MLNKSLYKTMSLVKYEAKNIKTNANKLIAQAEYSAYPKQDYFIKIKESLDTIYKEIYSYMLKNPANKDELLDALGLDVRTYNCLRRAGIDTIHQLTSKTKAELLIIPNFGKTKLADVLSRLKERNLKLKNVSWEEK